MRLLTSFLAVTLALILNLAIAQDLDEDDPVWIQAVMAKIKANVSLPDHVPPGAHVRMRIRQLRSGEILSIMIMSSSGSRSVDEAVMKAIQKSSPLPRQLKTEAFKLEFEIVWSNEE